MSMPNSVPSPDYPLQVTQYGSALPPAPSIQFGPFAPGAREDAQALDLGRYLAILVHRKWLLVFSVIMALIAGLTLTIRETPFYRASAVVEAQPPATNPFGFADYSTNTSGTNFIGDQIQILKSDALAQRVARDSRIVSKDSVGTVDQAPVGLFAELKAQLKDWIARVEGKAKGETEPTVELADDPLAAGQASIEQEVRNQLAVEPVSGTNMLRLSITDTNPQRAAALANAVAKAYVAMNMERRYQGSNRTQGFYDTQIRKTRAELEEMERKLIAYARGKDLVNLENLLDHNEKEFDQLKSQLFEAEQRLYQAEAKFIAMRGAGGDVGADFLNSPVIQQLKTRRGQLEDEYQLKLEVFLPDYPRMVQLRSQIEAIDRQIKGETTAIAKGIEVAYEAAKREKETLEQRVGRGREALLKMRDQTADYMALKREHMALQSIYDGLIGRIKEAGIVTDGGVNNLSILDLAKVPSRPFKPNLQQNLMVALGIGLALGVLLIFLIEMLDDTVKTADEVERLSGAPILGSIPFVGSRKQREDDSMRNQLLDPKSPAGEAGRSLRTTLLFATSGGAPKVLHFTSSAPGEGKTTTTLTTALAFVRSGATVLCVDADLRNPSLHKVFDVPNGQGLSNYLVSDIQPAEIAQAAGVEGIYVITSGPLPPNPVELLASHKMEVLLQLAAERFDYVFVDGPPVLGLADAPVLAGVAGATLFVVEPGQSRKAALLDSLKRLRSSQARVVGVVLQKVGRRGGGYGYGYGYKYDYQYMYGYGRTGRDLEQV
jgi:capsular exopolysaccharide synthesis family protein